MQLNTVSKHFTRYANVGNVVSVLIIVIIILLKPDGATMV
jgi:hypothetical protein